MQEVTPTNTYKLTAIAMFTAAASASMGATAQ
jgi:hypothetical protein